MALFGSAVVCLYAACTFTKTPKPPLNRIYQLKNLPTTTLIVAFLLFCLMTAAIIFFIILFKRSIHGRAGTTPHMFANAKEKTVREKAIKILSDSTQQDLTQAPSIELMRFGGTHRNTPLFFVYEDSETTYAVARSGKTRSLVARRIIEAPGAVIATSVKPDALALTWLARKKMWGSTTYAFDPLGTATGPTLIRWNPVLGCENFNTARERARAMVMGASTSMNGGNARWFAERSSQILGYFFHAAALDGRRIDSIHEWVSRPEEAKEILMRKGGSTGTMMVSALHDLMIDMAGETASGFKGTMQGALEPLLIPEVFHALTPPDRQSFNAETFLTTKDVLWVLTDETAGPLASITTMFVDYIYSTARKASNLLPAGRHTPPISFILDETAHIAPLPQLPSMFSEGAGRGIFTSAFFQDHHQVEEKWGKNEAAIIFQESRLVYTLGSSKDNEWNKKISELSAEYEENRESISTGRGGTSISTHKTRRHHLRPSDVANLPLGQAVLISPGNPADLVSLTDIAQDETWAELVNEGVAQYNTRVERRAAALLVGQQSHYTRVNESWMNQ